MDQNRPKTPYKKYNKTGKPKFEPSPLRKKAMALASQYGMEEAIALQIAAGTLPLEMWQKKQIEKKSKQEMYKKLQEKIAAFSLQNSLSLETSLQVLRGAFSLKEYRDQKISKMEKNKEAQEFAAQSNIPLHIAKMILDKKFTLEEYFAKQEQKKERDQKAQEIKKQYPDLALSTCYMIVDNKINVEEFIKNKDQNREKRKEWYKNYLKEHQEENQPLANYLQKLKTKKIAIFLSRLGHESLSGIVIGYSPYEIKIKDKQNAIHICPKISLKFFCRLAYAERALSLMKVSPKLQKEPIPPSSNPYERYEIPDDLLKEEGKISLMLREGETFSGTIKWFTKYDIKLSLSATPKSNILIFRHAVVAAQPSEAQESE
ncbi:MAG: hypothetical protein HUU50_11205 [Candidatus Brocadiae bacterium]|nr:hypothetical protein [Candidatus Brocadiia bacterium]